MTLNKAATKHIIEGFGTNGGPTLEWTPACEVRGSPCSHDPLTVTSARKITRLVEEDRERAEDTALALALASEPDVEEQEKTGKLGWTEMVLTAVLVQELVQAEPVVQD